MSSFSPSFTSLPMHLAPVKARMAAATKRVLTGLRSWQERREGRKAMFALQGMDDHFLRDIGVTRADVEAALLENETDPSVVLRQRRSATISASRATKSEAKAAL